VGIANQRKVVNQEGRNGIWGVIYSDSADKATRFIATVIKKKKIPLVFVQDTGFMVDLKSEQGGIIKDGADGKCGK
jgi:acetyl-CoA carboxylase carboxyltransferase component